MEKEIILTKKDCYGNGISGNGLSGNGFNYSDSIENELDNMLKEIEY